MILKNISIILLQSICLSCLGAGDLNDEPSLEIYEKNKNIESFAKKCNLGKLAAYFIGRPGYSWSRIRNIRKDYNLEKQRSIKMKIEIESRSGQEQQEYLIKLLRELLSESESI